MKEVGEVEQVNQPYPVLCGGTFFKLLWEIRKSQRKSDAFSQYEMLGALAAIVDPQVLKPLNRSTASNYKQCRREFCSLYAKGMSESQVDLGIEDFDKRIKEKYTSCLEAMVSFVRDYIRPEESPQINLVRALLKIISEDTSMKPDNSIEDVLRWDENKTKVELYLPEFLLNILHYVVVKRRDNKDGANTIEIWDKMKESNKNESLFKQIIGDGPFSKLEVILEKKDCKHSMNTVPANDIPDIDTQADNRTHSQDNTVAGRMRRQFKQEYSDCHIEKFLTDGAKNVIYDDSLAWVDCFIKKLESDILQVYSRFSLGDDAINLLGLIQRYVNTLRDYKGKLIQYKKERNKNWYLDRSNTLLEKIGGLGSDYASIPAITLFGEIPEPEKELSIEDSLEYDRKKLDQTYAEIVLEK